MKTLKELNEKAWYRLIKVLYVLLYLPYLLVLFIAYGSGKDYHPPVYPDNIEVALNDPEFYKVSDYDKSNALSAIDKDFKNLNYSEQTQFIDEIKKFDIKTTEIKKPEKMVMEKVTYNGKKGFWDGKRFFAVDDLKKVTYKGEKGYYSEETGFIPDEETKGQILPSKGELTEFFAIARKTPLPKVVEGKYFYASYYKRDVGKTIAYVFISALGYVLLMEIIRRIFYYVLIGKLFPKE
mgnify:CR=1 FL=1